VPPLTDEEAERLFLERARAVKPSFQPDEHVPAICRRLDNLPLAIELAAARLKVLSGEELLARLERRLPLLTGGARDRPERQRTLRATIEWSYDLLGEEEKRLFARLAVFAGGFTFDAAEEVAEAELDRVQSLVDENLVRQTADGRFFLLETIREFGLDLLRAADDAEDLRQRHARFYAALLVRERERLSPLATPAGGRFRQGLEPEVVNVRAAVEWALAADEVELALELLYESHCRMPLSARERLGWYERALGRAGSVTPATAAEAYRHAAYNNVVIGRLAEAETQAERSLSLYRGLDDRRGEARALRALGTIHTLANRTDEARDYLTSGLAIAEEHRFAEPLQAVTFIQELGEVELEAGNTARATDLLTQSVELARVAGDLGVAGSALHGLGDVLLDEGDPGAAEACYADALAIARDAVDRMRALHCLGGLAATAARERNAAERCGKLWGAVLAIEKEEAWSILGTHRVRYERALGAVAGPQFDAAVAEGQSMGFDDAIEFALASSAEAPTGRHD
jgi:predicted ATPase